MNVAEALIVKTGVHVTATETTIMPWDEGITNSSLDTLVRIFGRILQGAWRKMLLFENCS